MIVRSPHPDDPDRTVFVPLAYDRESQAWTPLQLEGMSCAFAEEAAATAALFVHVLALWRSVRHHVRLIRALSEHPAFEFNGDGIDAAMVRREAFAMSERSLRMNDAFLHLLADPGATKASDERPKGVEIAVDSADLVVLERLPDMWERELKSE